MVEAEEVENRGVEIVRGDDVVLRLEAKLVGVQRQVTPVLFVRGNGNDDGCILAKGFDIGPLEVGDFHRRSV